MKRKFVFLSIIFIIVLLIIFSFTFNNPKHNIEDILKSKYYSYLSENAKEYIREVYKNTGEILLTEKNKEAGKPYLNNSFIDYLDMSQEEREGVSLIPKATIIDYEYKENNIFYMYVYNDNT